MSTTARTVYAIALADADTARRLVDQLDRTCARLQGSTRAGRCAQLAAWLDRWCA
jgi:hypothetical protein